VRACSKRATGSSQVAIRAVVPQPTTGPIARATCRHPQRAPTRERQVAERLSAQRGSSPESRSLETASQRPPTCACQGQLAPSTSVEAAWESLLHPASEGDPRNMSPADVGQRAPVRERQSESANQRAPIRERQSESANQRAPTCDCQGEVATSGPVGATPQVATPNCDPNGAARESRARAASGRRTGPPPPGANRGHPPNAGAQ
jgi:hypothetical protein